MAQRSRVMASPIMARKTARKRRPGKGAMVARYGWTRKRPERAPRFKSEGSVARRRHVLGAPGRSGPAHIVQFRPVGIERLCEEGAPEGQQFGERLCSAGAVRGRGGKGGGSDCCHDAEPAVFIAAFAASTLFVALKTSFGPIR